jgi:NAD+ kinase
MSRRSCRVAVLGHTRRPGVRRAAALVRRLLARRGCPVRIHEGLSEETGERGYSLSDLAGWCHLLVTLGGDGTALTGARAIAGGAAALLPVNLGGMGFLTVVEERDLPAALKSAITGEWPVVRRRVVGAVVRRSGRAIHRGVALNDAVVKGGYAAIHLRMHALGEDLGHMVADGVIAATSAGSTAYSLSAGGPVVAPDMEALIVTPVCAHSLASRSLILPAGSPVRLKLINAFDRTLLLFDGQESVGLRRGDEVELRLERKSVRVVWNPHGSFARALLEKLGWQGSTRRSM